MIDSTFIIPMVQMPSIMGVDNGISVKNTETNSSDGMMSFADTLKEKIAQIKVLEQKSLDSAYAIATGQSEDIESAMIDSTKASVAIETAVQITTRAVNAYKEIMQMQI